MDKILLKNMKIDQIGIVVEDVEKAIKGFGQIIGSQNFQTFEYPDSSKKSEVYYRGKPADYSAKIGFAKVGGMEIELIQHLSGKSIYNDFLLKNGPGIHHFRISLPADEFDSLCTHMMEEGIAILSEGPGVRSDSRWIVFDTHALIGADLELKKI